MVTKSATAAHAVAKQHRELQASMAHTATSKSDAEQPLQAGARE